MRRLAAVAITALFLVNACASETTDAPNSPTTVQESEAASNQDSDRSKNKKDRGKERKSGDSSSNKASAGSGSSGEGSRSEDRDDGDPANDGSGSRTAAYPAAGTYSFAQSGYEEFCDNTGNCDKEQLPKRQPTELTYDSSSNDSALVVAEQRQSGSRLTRTWTRFTPSGAHITKMYVKFSYSGFTFERTYEPQPPVEALRFPMKQGESWSGEWRASTSGSYSVKIGARTQIDVGGRSVSAYRVETTTEFRGDFEGKSRLIAYVDPDTKAIVATDGVLNVTSNFGRYSTVFETKLTGGPRY